MKKRIKGLSDGEVAVKTVKKQFLVFQSAEYNNKGTDYVRFIDKKGKELLYYDNKEWMENPVEVMGAIMGAICGGADL